MPTNRPVAAIQSDCSSKSVSKSEMSAVEIVVPICSASAAAADDFAISNKTPFVKATPMDQSSTDGSKGSSNWETHFARHGPISSPVALSKLEAFFMGGFRPTPHLDDFEHPAVPHIF